MYITYFGLIGVIMEGLFIQLNTRFIMYNFYVLYDTHFESFRTYQDMQQISQT